MGDREVIAQWTRLTCAALATCPGFRDGPAAEAKIRRQHTEALCRARLDGHVAIKTGPRGLEAILTAHRDPGSWYGAEIHAVAIGAAPDAPDAPAWIVDQLRALGDLGPLDLNVPLAWRPVIDAILAADLGLGVDSVVLVGAPAPALAALIDRYDPPADLTAWDLTAGPLRDEAEVDAALALKHRVFAAHPEYCWFGAHPRFLARERADLLLRLDDPTDELGEALRHDGRLVGLVGLHVEDDDPCWGRVAGVDLTLDPTLWGRGLAKTLYRRGLTRLVERGVQVFKGGTAQPPVLGLGRQMGRAATAVYLRPRVAFDRAHFQGYI